MNVAKMLGQFVGVLTSTLGKIGTVAALAVAVLVVATAWRLRQ